MEVFMKCVDILRTMIGIRTERQLLPIGEKPQVGSNIALQSLRMQLKYPIDSEFWDWLCSKGWRTIDLRYDRRQYTLVSDEIVIRLMKGDERKRDATHRHLVNAIVSGKSEGLTFRTRFQ
jgi:hypothetical protein